MPGTQAHPEDGPPALLESLARHRARPADAARPDAVARQHSRAALTARERIDGPGRPPVVPEYGLLAMPATPDLDGAADGVVTGLARVREPADRDRLLRLHRIAGSQGDVGNTKVGRVLQIAEEQRPSGSDLRRGRRAPGPGGDDALARRRRKPSSPPWPACRARCRLCARARAGVRGQCDHSRACATSSWRTRERGDRDGRACRWWKPPSVNASLPRRSARGIHAAAGAAEAVADDEHELIRADLGIPVVLRGPPGAGGTARSARAACAPSCRQTRASPMTFARLSPGWRSRARSSSCGHGFAQNLVTALGRVDGWPVGFVASQPLVLARRDRRRGVGQGLCVSSSCATPSACR